MPIETGNVTTIRPAGPSSRTEGPGSANAASGASEASGFSPRTDVLIRGAVSDMAGVLSKITQNQTEAVEQMPQELQKVVENMLQQAFSVDETLAQGLGSTLESQRFTIDQLSTLSRMLGQMAALSDAGGEASADETMQALLTGLKSLLSDSGRGAEPVLLTKAAFELLDNQEVSNLPKGIQDLLTVLSSQGGETGAGMSAGEPMQLLVKLVRSFMPPSYQEAQGQAGASNAAESADIAAQNRGADGSAPQGTQKSVPAQNGTAPRAENTTSPVQNGTAASSEDAADSMQDGQKSAIAGTVEKGQMQQGNQPVGVNSKGNSEQNPHIVGKVASAGMEQVHTGETVLQQETNPSRFVGTDTEAATETGKTQTMMAGSADRGTAGRTSGPASYAASVQNHAYQAYERAGNPVFQQPLQPDNPDSMQFAMAHAKNAMLASKIQNTPETMQTLRNLAVLLLQNAVLSDSDTALLQNFLQGGNTQAMPQKNLENLQNLLRLCQQNVPTSVQQAAIQQNIPDLPKVWSFMQLADMTNTRKMNAAQLKRAGKDIASFATSLKHAMTGDSVQLQDQRALDFMQPVYLNNGKVQYPAYIHVYDENKKDARIGEQKKETWFRVCMLTQHIGAIELTCRVYDEGQLDMRMFFSNSDTAEEFIPFIPEIKDNLKDSSLHIHDFHVDTEGAAHF